jgi:hypothetical protein
MHFGTLANASFEKLCFCGAKLDQAQEAFAFSSTPHNLVPDMAGLVLHRRIFGHPIGWWWNCGESFLSVTRRLPAEVLVVEGWIGRDGIHAARTEFDQHGYQNIVTTGGMTSGFWEDGLSNYAEMAAGELIRLGVPTDKIVVARATETESHRTYESAVAVWRALEAKGIHPKPLMCSRLALTPCAAFWFSRRSIREPTSGSSLGFHRTTQPCLGGGPASGPGNCSRKPPAFFMKLC